MCTRCSLHNMEFVLVEEQEWDNGVEICYEVDLAVADIQYNICNVRTDPLTGSKKVHDGRYERNGCVLEESDESGI